jgi:hypothetical protein
MSDEILAAARAELTGEPLPEAPVEETPIEEAPADDVPEQETQDEVESHDEPEPRGGVIPPSVLRKEKEKRREAEARAERVESELAAMRAEIAALKNPPKEIEPEPVPDDVYDEATYRKTAELEKEVKNTQAGSTNQFIAIDERIARAQNPNYDNIRQAIIAADAYEMLADSRARGDALSEEKAIEYAMAIDHDRRMQIANKQKSVSEYYFNRAQQIIKASGTEDKPLPKKPQPDINKIDQHRKSAGGYSGKATAASVVDADSLMEIARKEALAESLGIRS